jgi:hypothetical protein
MATATSEQLRVEFFEWLFGKSEGYICLATGEAQHARKTFRQKFFHWPTQKEDIVHFIHEHEKNKNLWFCVNLLSQPERKKEFCINQNIVWADLDSCNPSTVEPKPTIVIISSNQRYQALWKLDQTVPVEVAEDYSKRLAYRYKQDGADPSGWDLTQLLRVPFTTNFKYDDKPIIGLSVGSGGIPEVPVTEFEEIDDAPLPELEGREEVGVPATETLPPVDKVLYKYQSWLDRSFYELYEAEPTEENDWSARMWKLLNLAFEAGMEKEEVFTIGLNAKCNKYIRDSRPMRYLWLEVLKAERIQSRIEQITGNFQPLLIPHLVDGDMLPHDTFIDRYTEWATNSTDAVPVYHELSAAILLSAILANNIRIEVSYGTIVPNLWGLILGESTLTRKTTAMQLAMSMLNEVDQEALMTNDGTAEGLLQSLSNRTGRTSIFFKDEVSGFFDAINNKKYLAGVPEILTHLYDSPRRYVRSLAKSEIVVQNPILIFFGGGISEKTYANLTDEYVLSGFLPRFLVVNGSVDLSRIRPTGPKNMSGNLIREKLVNELLDLREVYNPVGYVTVAGQQIPLDSLVDRPMVTALFSSEAWEYYGQLEMAMVMAANESSFKDKALPTFERLSRSLMKLAVLLSATRQEPRDSAIQVDIHDIQHAARFIQSWGRFSVDLILNVGKSNTLRTLERVRHIINERPGIFKSEIMRSTHLSSREMADVITTLIDRGEITRRSPQGKGRGRSEQFWAVS